MSTSRNIHLELYQARLLYNTLPGYMMDDIKQTLMDEYGCRNLEFNPKPNDILASDDHIILFNKFSDIEPTSNRNLGRNVLGLIVYNISEDTIYMNTDCDIESNIVGRENQFMYATDEQKKLFYSKMSNLSNNI